LGQNLKSFHSSETFSSGQPTVIRSTQDLKNTPKWFKFLVALVVIMIFILTISANIAHLKRTYDVVVLFGDVVKYVVSEK